MPTFNTALVGIFATLAAVFVFALDGALLIPAAHAAAGKGDPMISPVNMRERDFYTPNSENLAPDEIRVIACGTGMPTPRPAQAAACFLMELGNGDKFIFDIGQGRRNGFSLYRFRKPFWTRCSSAIYTGIISEISVPCS